MTIRSLTGVGRAALLLTIAGAGLSACGTPPSATANQAAAANAADMNETAAIADAAGGAEACERGTKLPITGICAGRAVAYLNTPGGGAPDAPDGCSWVVRETRMGDDALLYQAARCGKATTALTYSAKPGLGTLSADGQPVVLVGDASGDGTAQILADAAPSITDAAEKAKCKVRKAEQQGWPDDALVVDTLTAKEAASAESDGPRAACGSYGYNGDEASYWRVFQGHRWFFRLGQDSPTIDPGSLTLMHKGSDGSWTQVD